MPNITLKRWNGTSWVELLPTPASHTQAISTISDSTTVGQNLVKLTNPGSVTFLRVNADNTVSTLSDTDFRAAISAAPAVHNHDDRYYTEAEVDTKIEEANKFAIAMSIALG